MRLTIKKSQSKGMMGGVTFKVQARVQLDSEEQRLIEYYKLQNTLLFRKKLTVFGVPIEKDEAMTEVRVRDLLHGEGYSCKDLAEVIGYTDSLRNACEHLQSYLSVAKTFDREEVFEIPPPTP